MAKSTAKKPGFLAQNKKAFVDYEVVEKMEAGIVLSGPEVKSCRLGHASLKGSYVEISDQGEAFVRKMHISPFKNAVVEGYEPEQKRKLLLKKNEITNLIKKLDTKGIAVVPLDLHISHNLIKVTIAICNPKKHYDRRNELKKKAQNMEIKRTLKRY